MRLRGGWAEYEIDVRFPEHPDPVENEWRRVRLLCGNEELVPTKAAAILRRSHRHHPHLAAETQELVRLETTETELGLSEAVLVS